MVNGPVSRIEWVEDQLRHALLSGDLRPGDRLLTAQLAERFQVSPTPLREALHHLAGEGLVEFVPQRGARVTELSSSDSLELTQLRELLEPPTVRDAITHADEFWSDNIEATSTVLVECWRHHPHDARSSELAYQGFYSALTATCSSKRLRQYSSAIRDQDARYRLASITVVDRDALRRLHSDLMNAARDGDPDETSEKVIDEIRLFSAGYATYAEATPMH